jgi:type II secretory pathway pseudopilin PulG
MKMKKRGQVWIETVLYTLIGLALIGLALGFIMPKINQARDSALVDQAVNSMNAFDEKINEAIERGPGNRRETEFLIKKGELYINSSGEEVMLVITGLSKPVSQPDVDIQRGRIRQRDVVEQKTNSVYLRMNYRANITYANTEVNVTKFTAAALPYKFFIENKGYYNNMTVVNIEEISNR